VNADTSRDDPGAVELGACARVIFTAVSEVGWWDTERMLTELEPYGGLSADQWQVSLSDDNAAGSCTLVEVEKLEGGSVHFLMDAGWNRDYMAERLETLGVDRLLAEGQVAFLYLTHEHLDHLWGVEAVLRHRPDIRIIAPGTLRPEARRLLAGGRFAGVANSVAHEGELVLLDPGRLHPLLPGCGSVGFDLPIVLSVRGEQSLVFRLHERGLVLATGCCHQSILEYADWIEQNLPVEPLHGLYGGLHIAPFAELTEEQARAVEQLGSYGFQGLAVNHCTGLSAVEKMKELGYPVVPGTASAGSHSLLYIGNGDSVTFG
jgi:7,8-dihydropterin-6-yl-methyl-4-(beta-D-ribofuranosyl)aminobenzene 5'-phosphate synthase